MFFLHRICSLGAPDFPGLHSTRHYWPTATTVSSGMKCLWNILAYWYNTTLKTGNLHSVPISRDCPPRPTTLRVGTPANPLRLRKYYVLCILHFDFSLYPSAFILLLAIPNTKDSSLVLLVLKLLHNQGLELNLEETSLSQCDRL